MSPPRYLLLRRSSSRIGPPATGDEGRINAFRYFYRK